MKNSVRDTTQVEGLISVIVPVFNGEQYVAKCLDSLMNQTYRNIEIIMIDDGSTDAGGKVIDDYAGIDKRIKAIHTENAGPAAARNTGLEHSRGELIFFIDVDDYIEQSTFDLLIENYRKYNADIMVADFIKETNHKSDRSGNDLFFKDSTLLEKNEIIDYTVTYLNKPNRFPLFAYSWGRLFNASIIRRNNLKFDPDLHTFEDVEFNYKYLRYTDKVYFLNQAVYHHLLHGNYSSATMSIVNDPAVLFGYRGALKSIAGYLEQKSNLNFSQNINHAYTCLTIIQLVRICGQLNSQNKPYVAKFIRELLGSPELQHAVKSYTPTGKDSRLLPVLMKLKFRRLLMLVCKYKANKRYKTSKALKR